MAGKSGSIRGGGGRGQSNLELDKAATKFALATSLTTSLTLC
ncbi:MAG: hypothetical protein VYE59_03790 [Candidatus Thermoplasmatota archaeon]|nr:hypothetical protein [Candidatus Thermoplasmatota archaeon]